VISRTMIGTATAWNHLPVLETIPLIQKSRKLRTRSGAIDNANNCRFVRVDSLPLGIRLTLSAHPVTDCGHEPDTDRDEGPSRHPHI